MIDDQMWGNAQIYTENKTHPDSVYCGSGKFSITLRRDILTPQIPHT